MEPNTPAIDPIFIKGRKDRHPKREKPRRRMSIVTKAEKRLVDQFVRDLPHEITERQVTALSTLLERPRASVKRIIEDARERFAASAGKYVDIHMQATEGALVKGDFEVAAKASQWALTNISGEGARVVDRPDDTGPAQPKVLIGIKLGGLGPDTRNNVTIPSIDVTEPHADPRG